MTDAWLRELWAALRGSRSTEEPPVDAARIWEAALGECRPEETRELLERVSRDPVLAEEWRLALAVQAIDWTPATASTAQRLGQAVRSALEWLVPEGQPSFGLSWQVAGVLGAPRVRPGDRFQVRIGPVSDPEGRRIVVLARRRADWEVVFPVSQDEDITLLELPSEADGSRTLDLLAGEPAGRQRWAVVLPSATEPLDFGVSPRQRWASLAEEVALGEVPVATVEVEVEVALAK